MVSYPASQRELLPNVAVLVHEDGLILQVLLWGLVGTPCCSPVQTQAQYLVMQPQLSAQC